ncbi:hypothetical protein IQ07DRAFT_605791 [Pyrenochaeta sp. DS3sAY3a]|nr:hypothetical protein IQ07DRAFT_605791 [Pyrenochaeta sp. DS3sAY3a]
MLAKSHRRCLEEALGLIVGILISSASVCGILILGCLATGRRGLIINAAAIGISGSVFIILVLVELRAGSRRSRKRALRVLQLRQSTDPKKVSLGQSYTQHTIRNDPIKPHCLSLSTPDIEVGTVIRHDTGTASTYTPMNESEIRLLQIEGSNDENSSLNTSLVHMPLLAARKKGFVALSYTWTEAAATSPILVNGKLLRVRTNLTEILRKVRLLKHEFIWVDALCINQADVQERSQQVLRMGGIYAGALSVLVCINILQSDRLAHALTLVNPALSVVNQSDQLHKLCSTEPIQSAVLAYCLENYWRRIWIVQEFAIGHKVELLIGDKTFSVQSLYILIQLLSRNSIMRELSQAQAIFDIRHSWQQNTRYTVLEILKRTSSSICGRRHDRIYGLLGLVPDFLDYLSEPSYEISTCDMSISMATSYIERRSLDIIVIGPYHNGPLGLPTWCPDFFHFDLNPPDDRAFKLLCHHMGYTQRNSGRELRGPQWDATKSAPRTCTFKDNKLFTSAYRVGEISSLGHAWSDVPSHDFPICSTQGERPPKKQKVGQILNAAMLRRDFCYYEQLRSESEPTDRPTPSSVEDFCFLQLFSPMHGDFDPDDIGNELHRWVSANRKFVFGERALQEHAENLWPIFFHCGIGIWFCRAHMFSPLLRMAKQDMRLMCLHDHKFGIGWAAKGARLHDEVFLIPGCSFPVILRRAETDGQYLMVGDAIVIGAMKGEVWENVKSEDLCQIEII